MSRPCLSLSYKTHMTRQSRVRLPQNLITTFSSRDSLILLLSVYLMYLEVDFLGPTQFLPLSHPVNPTFTLQAINGRNAKMNESIFKVFLQDLISYVVLQPLSYLPHLGRGSNIRCFLLTFLIDLSFH